MHGFSTEVANVSGGATATIACTHYHGCLLLAGNAAPATARVYAGNSNGDPLIGGANAVTSDEGFDHGPTRRMDRAMGGDPTSSIFVEVAGAGSECLVFYSV